MSINVLNAESSGMVNTYVDIKMGKRMHRHLKTWLPMAMHRPGSKML